MLKWCLVLALLLQTAPEVRFDSNRAWEHLRQLVSIGPRRSGSPSIDLTRQYLKGQLAAAAITVAEQKWVADTPAGKGAMVNLIATVPGTRKDRIVFAGHYDTKRFPKFRFVGASDGGSSAAFVLELARILKARRNPFTMEFLFLDGEEAVNEVWAGTDNTYGSRHYVESAQRDGSLSGLKSLVLLDMIGDRSLQIRRDSNSTPWLTELVWSAARRQKLDTYFIAESTQVEDDHVPFLKAGVPSVDIIDLDYPQWHTAQDTLDAVSARSLQVVGDVVLAAIPDIEARLIATR